MSLLDWELSRNGVHVLGDLGTTVTICHGRVPVFDKLDGSNRDNMRNPALNIFGYEFEMHVAEKPMRDYIFSNIDLDILVASLDERHSLVLLGGLNLQASDRVEHMASVPTALNRSLSTPVMKADVTDWDPALRLFFIRERITAQVVKENVEALSKLAKHCWLNSSFDCGDRAAHLPSVNNRETFGFHGAVEGKLTEAAAHRQHRFLCKFALLE